MRILCARYRHLGLVTALRRFAELRGEPVIVGGAPELRLPVIAASPAAARAGVRPGQPLRQAQQLCPAAAFVPFDAAATEALRAEISARLHQLAPTVEVSDEEALCDLSGRHAAYPDEGAWGVAASRVLTAVLDADPPAVGIAGSRFVARMAARESRPGRLRRVRPGEETAFLAPLPLAVLPVDRAITARLADFGLDCLGAVAALSPAELQRQFGPAGMEVHRLLRAQDGDGILGGAVHRVWTECVVLDPPVAELETLVAAARRCARITGDRLQAEGLSCGEVGVTMELEDAPAVAAAAVLAAPAGSGAEVWTAVLALLGELHPSAPVSALRVELTRIAPGAGRQADLLRPGDAARDSIAAAATRLRTRFGEAAARRPKLAVDPGDLPERRFVWEAPVAAGAVR
ncbi:MAG TPA: hypothetical protein VF155_03770 [Candidatus Dormibacteraeota bacterium]